MRRYFVTLGAPTSAGGRVISASSASHIEGAAIALEGDLVACPVCNTTGKIGCVGPRIPETWNGRNVALENDLCICRCDSPPRLLTSQVLRSQVIKDSGRALSNPLPPHPERGTAGQVYAGQFQLIDEDSGMPVGGRQYALVRGSGKIEFGTGDSLGLTHVLSATAQPEYVEIYVQGPLASASLISPSGTVLHHRMRIRTVPVANAAPRQVRVRGCLGTEPVSVERGDELVTFLPETGP
ncbi:PAAR domain-containing protein [Massilia sp. PAMC28688]|uniref:PAAR domain-containing protein n=1 Tax=Massilia sp. PAMC28688 TaxID=2861283 RepID=UPI001C6377DD|nr:PAAR domain-containing protein [Massilia sp. PAMC28688]QYF94190.1 PAAR domain-containing protein [Massilia sp. PAMC28688]